jgi:hypothetical protein
VSTPDQRARDKDRDAAIEVVEAAWADGQIIEADRDKRVEELLRAQTLGEIQMLTHDLQPPAAAPAPVPVEAVPVESPPLVSPAGVDYGAPMPLTDPSATTARPVTFPKALLLVPLVVALVIGISVVGGIVALVREVDDGIESVTDSPSYAPGVEPEKGDVNVISAAGYADLVAAVKEETGGTQAFSAVLYPTYAVVELPADVTTQREKYYYWDGRDLNNQDANGTSSADRFDLSTIDPAVVVRLVQNSTEH